MSLETNSKALKYLVAGYNADWLLGDLSGLIHAGKERARDQLGRLSSPMRQLYYLAGLNVSSAPGEEDVGYSREKWGTMVTLLNQIENDYEELFYSNPPGKLTEDWIRVRKVAVPSFLSYFNQGPLNFEEQVINWVQDLFTPLDATIEIATGVTTGEFLLFYQNLDGFRHTNFQAHAGQKRLLRPNWKKYTKIQMGVADEAPDFIKEMAEPMAPEFSWRTDQGMIDRFYPSELVTKNLSIEKVNVILAQLRMKREPTDYLYYTGTRPGNPLIDRPILDIGGGMYQVFEVKQVIHTIRDLLETVCSQTKPDEAAYVKRKGKLLESRVLELFEQFFRSGYKAYKGYYVDGKEQDILILWKKYAFIVETKGYSMREPFRNPEKAFVRIKDDFNDSIGYGFEQSERIATKFIEQMPLIMTDAHGLIVEEIDTSLYDEEFSIVVNMESFGQVQCDLSAFIEPEEGHSYPWAVKLDDLEIFFLTMIARKMDPTDLVDFLLFRETLHGKLICSDELEICGGYLTGGLDQNKAEKADMVRTHASLGDVFDAQYHKSMGFKNEKYLYEKKIGKFLFW